MLKWERESWNLVNGSVCLKIVYVTKKALQPTILKSAVNKHWVRLGRVAGITQVIPSAYFSILFYLGFLNKITIV